MKFQSLAIHDARLLELKVQKDERGFFIRTFCKKTLQQECAAYTCEQSSMSVTQKAGTLRGLHFQCKPHMEGKFVRCVRGKVYDVIVDLRNESPTYGKWLAIRCYMCQKDVLTGL
jgi:dTDP-4-dehydrorhamnose 3,5-epimerase